MAEIEVLNPPFYMSGRKGPVVFLAGPVRGARDWQTEAFELLKASYYLDSKLLVASPRVIGTSYHAYADQVNWETHYLKEASKSGVITFWCSKEAEHNCERPFGQCTRYELGEWLAKSEMNKTQVVVGIESGFTGEKYIRHRLTNGDFKHIPVTSTLEETVEATVFLLASKEDNNGT